LRSANVGHPGKPGLISSQAGCVLRGLLAGEMFADDAHVERRYRKAKTRPKVVAGRGQPADALAKVACAIVGDHRRPQDLFVPAGHGAF
jgi:hypothetical protein